MKPLIAPNPRNPRVITDERIAALRHALIKFGDLGGIVCNRRNNQLIGGHQRIQAFQTDEKARIEITENLKKPDKQGTVAYGWVYANATRYAYRLVDWDEDMETAAMIAANKFSGEWEWEGVSKLLQELKAGEFDMTLTGFEAHELDTLLNAEWKLPEITNDAPPATDGDKSDRVYLTPNSREALEWCKKALQEKDDSKAVERLALFFRKEQTA